MIVDVVKIVVGNTCRKFVSPLDAKIFFCERNLRDFIFFDLRIMIFVSPNDAKNTLFGLILTRLGLNFQIEEIFLRANDVKKLTMDATDVTPFFVIIQRLVEIEKFINTNHHNLQASISLYSLL